MNDEAKKAINNVVEGRSPRSVIKELFDEPLNEIPNSEDGDLHDMDFPNDGLISMGEKDFEVLLKRLLEDGILGAGPDPIEITSLKDIRDQGSDPYLGGGSGIGLVVAQGPVEFYITISKNIRKS